MSQELYLKLKLEKRMLTITGNIFYSDASATPSISSRLQAKDESIQTTNRHNQYLITQSDRESEVKYKHVIIYYKNIYI